MSTIKVSVIGCGHWGKNLIRNFYELGALHSICDANTQQAEKFAKQYDVLNLNYDQVLQSDVDGVVIAAPAEQHYTLAKKALNAGKNVFVEKPLSLDIDEAQELCDLSHKVQKKLMVGHLLQYHPAFLELKRLLEQGHLGKLQYIYSNRLNLGKIRTEENILWSFAPHDISMILGLVGDQPDSVYATGSCHLNPTIQDVTTTHLSFKNGVEAHVFVSWLHPFKEQKLVVVGDKAMAVFDDSLSWEEKLKLYSHQVHWIDGKPQAEKADGIHVDLAISEPLRMECQHFIDSIATNQQPRTDGHEGLRVLRVLDAAQKSLHLKQNVNLQIKSASYYAHETAIIDQGADIGKGTKIWHFSHILKNVKIGENCIIGQNVMIGPDAQIGQGCKIQNNVSLYKGVILEENVFCGPSCVFTNVNTPRANVERKDEFDQTYVEKGASIGANATIVC
ncbi:MAG: Gfo/Idh/MocA family oxidoreductase, partial [Alphaproteobacteria bacterium]|nr:Gfo/Idh/MocA family oxidoreductase [Alphaproteobacteria bacterium]